MGIQFSAAILIKRLAEKTKRYIVDYLFNIVLFWLHIVKYAVHNGNHIYVIHISLTIVSRRLHYIEQNHMYQYFYIYISIFWWYFLTYTHYVSMRQTFFLTAVENNNRCSYAPWEITLAYNNSEDYICRNNHIMVDLHPMTSYNMLISTLAHSPSVNLA